MARHERPQLGEASCRDGVAKHAWPGSPESPSQREVFAYQIRKSQLAGGCIGANVFSANEAPVYPTGFTIIFVLVSPSPHYEHYC